MTCELSYGIGAEVGVVVCQQVAVPVGWGWRALLLETGGISDPGWGHDMLLTSFPFLDG
jgi:hypothetical protein